MACAKVYWVFNEAAGPCSGCCDPAYAIDNDSVWRCNCGSWPVLDSEPVGQMAEQFAAIAARLNPPAVKPLFTDLPDLFGPEGQSRLWGDILMEAEERLFDALSEAQQKAAREASARSVREMQAAADAAQRHTFAQIAVQRMRSQPAAGKLAEPCKFLYVATGGKEPDSRSICSECWRHEFVNPQTGKKETPHACNRLHPGEAGWKEEWSMLPVPRNRFRIQHAPQAQGVRFFPGTNGRQMRRW